MTSVTVVGGVYHERCIWPDWDQIWGSGGRAAAAICGHVDKVRLRTFARSDTASVFARYAELYGFEFDPVDADQTVSFEYVHCLSDPHIRPIRERIRQNPALSVSDDIVLRFGMLEGDAIVDSEFCIYDPQSAFTPERFEKNGSKASRLAIVANRNEVQLMTAQSDAVLAAQELLHSGAEIVVVKCGAEGAILVERDVVSPIPAFESAHSWTIGSGDVFAAMFAARWAVHRDTPARAAELASKAVAEYAESMALPIPGTAALDSKQRRTVARKPGRVYLAGPFFSLGQRWLVDEVRNSFSGFGLEVFSPVHDVGRGPGEEVGPADLEGLDGCDRVFALLDGLDSGTVFEVGYARRMGLPVYALAQAVPPEDLKMMVGSQCKIFDDLSTAVHQTTWLL